MNKTWNYVAKDGNPKKEGTYWVTLIWTEKTTGRELAEVDARWFGDASEGYAMSDQPKEGLVWTEECGSVRDERVIAWMEIDQPEIATLPDGVEEVHTKIIRQEVTLDDSSFEKDIVVKVEPSGMQVTVSKENYTIKDDWIKVGTFEDLHHPVLFVKSILDEYEENGTPVRLSVEFTPGNAD